MHLTPKTFSSVHQISSATFKQLLQHIITAPATQQLVLTAARHTSSLLSLQLAFSSQQQATPAANHNCSNQLRFVQSGGYHISSCLQQLATPAACFHHSNNQLPQLCTSTSSSVHQISSATFKQLLQHIITAPATQQLVLTAARHTSSLLSLQLAFSSQQQATPAANHNCSNQLRFVQSGGYHINNIHTAVQLFAWFHHPVNACQHTPAANRFLACNIRSAPLECSCHLSNRFRFTFSVGQLAPSTGRQAPYTLNTANLKRLHSDIVSRVSMHNPQRSECTND